MEGKGFKQLRYARPGELVMFKSGSVALITEYYSSNDAVQRDAYICGTGEALHADAGEWVLILDIDGAIAHSEELTEIKWPQNGGE